MAECILIIHLKENAEKLEIEPKSAPDKSAEKLEIEAKSAPDKGGRKSMFDDIETQKINRMVDAGISKRATSRLMGVSEKTIRNYLK